MQHHPVFPPSPGDPISQILCDWLQALLPCFTAPSWERILVRVMGAVLTLGTRTLSTGALVERVRNPIDAIAPAEAANFFTAAGYELD